MTNTERIDDEHLVTDVHRFTIVKVYLIAGLGLLLLTGSFYLFGLYPLHERLREEHSLQIDQILTSKQWLVEGVISQYRGLAQQFASRTAIRNKLVAYQQGEIDREELISFSQPKLADALNANSHVHGISRFAVSGTLLYSVGVPLPNGIVEKCAFERLKAIRMLNPIRNGNARRLYYCSPIVDEASGLVGIDILTMDEDAIQNIIDETLGHHTGVITISIVIDGDISYWPASTGQTIARSILETYLKTGNILDDYLVSPTAMGIDGWQLFAVTNEKQFFRDINHDTLILTGIITVIAVMLFLLTVVIMRPVINTLLREQRLIEVSQRDGLTGLFNHAFMQKLLKRELSRSVRYQRPISILMFDIDHFKKINDTYGHVAGDEVLKRIADVVREAIRAEDFAARYGGEEFLLIMPETGEEGSSIVAKRLLADVAAKPVITDAGDISVTISIGIVQFDLGPGDFDTRKIVMLADEAMYASKNNGRDQITYVSQPK